MNKTFSARVIASVLLIGLIAPVSHAASKAKAPTAEELALEARVAPHRQRAYAGISEAAVKNAATRVLNDLGFFVAEASDSGGTVTGARRVEMKKEPSKSQKSSRPRNIHLSLTIRVDKPEGGPILVEINGLYNSKTPLTDVAILDQLHQSISANAIGSDVMPIIHTADDPEEEPEGEKIA